jgi:hypothetical protein
MDPKEIGGSGVEWINVARDRDKWRVLVNRVMNLFVSRNFGKLLSSCTTGGFSRGTQLN